MLIQSSGRVCSIFRVPLQVFKTILFLVAKNLYFLFVDTQSKVSFAFILVIHLFLTSSLLGQASLGRSAQILWLLRCQISITDLAIRILYKQLSPGLGFPFGVLKFARAHLVMLPTLFIIGQVPGFLCSHISFANCQTCFCPTVPDRPIVQPHCFVQTSHLERVLDGFASNIFSRLLMYFLIL